LCWLLVFAEPAKAQAWRAAYWGLGRGYGGWGSPYWGYGRWGYYGPSLGYYSYGWPGYYGYGWYYPYGYTSWYGYWPNAYYTYGSYYYPSWYGTNYAPYYSYGVITGTPNYSTVATETPQTGNYYGTTTTSSDSVLINVKVPLEAEIWFDNHKTAQTGTDRRFITPSLDPGRTFTYDVHARWTEGNRPVDQTRKVTVHAGDQLTVDFTARLPGRNEAAAARSEDIRAPQTKTHEGRVVRFSNHELVMKGADGREHTHTLANDAKVTIDGQPGRGEDLKPNMKIEVTTPQGDAKSALRIEAKSSE
jgi:uncharacterized protein (TIGR03000 family)